MKQLNNIIPVLFFLILALILVAPLFPPGYILTLDQVLTAKIQSPNITSASFLFNGLMYLFNIFLPSYLLQKVILMAIFFFSGWGMYRLIPQKYGEARLFGGIFYAINPFVYERVMAGQWNLLLGYSLLPFFVVAVLDFFNNPDKNNAIKLAVFTTVITSIVIHFSLILACFFLIYGFIFILFHQGKIYSLTEYFLLFAGLVFLFNINWILPTFLGKSGLSETIGTFTPNDLIAFQSVEDKRFGLVFNLLSGYGFWPEVYKYFVIPKDIIFFWPLLSVSFILLSSYGVIKILKEKENSLLFLLATLVVLFLLSLDFAGGIALKSFANTIFSLYDKFPFLYGFREPQKLVGVLMFCYAIFGSIGLSFLVTKVKKSLLSALILIAFFISPFVYTPTVLGGFWGQLKPVFYPSSWTRANQILNSDRDKYLTLFFPWHQYMKFNFNNGRIVANPAPNFFDKTILSSQNYETIPLYSHDTRLEALHVEGLLRIEKEGVNLLGEKVEEKFPWGESLSPINVKYIILSKDDDWQSYKFLNNSSDLENIFETDEIILYKNLKWGMEVGPEENSPN